MHHIDIVFPCVFLPHPPVRLLRSSDFNHFLRRILSVSLNTDCKDKILPFCGIHRLVKVFLKVRHPLPIHWRSLQNIHKLFAGIMVKSHMVIYLCTAVEISTVMCSASVPYPSALSADAALSTYLSWHTSYTDTLPVRKKRILIPVSTSNSVFAVPAPTDGALKYPLE
mgnify:CR=1 FL=1